MSKLAHVKKFYFGSAKYHLDDGNGDKIMMIVDYWHGNFTIRTKTRVVNPAFRQEVESIAKQLLSKKHQTNFADRVQIQ
jgi:hypothetical protein